MENKDKTREQLMDELIKLRQQIAELESSEAEGSKVTAESIGETLEAVVVMDLDGTIRQVNNEFERGLGWKSEEAIGKTPVELGFMSKEEYRMVQKD